MDGMEFRRLVETHQRMVFSLALRVTGEYETAEEVAQDAFLELYRAGDGLESEDHVRFWLRRVTVHRATDALRRRALPEAMRVAVVLRYQEEMSPDEIATLLGQPVATVKSHLQRGLQLLRRKGAVTMKEYLR